MQLFSFQHEPPVKARCCNYRTSVTYWLAETEDAARRGIEDHTDGEDTNHGLCARCMADLLASEDYEIQRRGEQEGRIFIVHPDGTDKIYNLQRVAESDLPGYFAQFTLPEDDSWQDVAERWMFYDATHLSEAEIERILETHNEDCERILDFGDFIGFTPFIRNSLSTGGSGE